MKKQQQSHAYAVDSAAGEPAVEVLDKFLAATVARPEVAARYRGILGRFVVASFGAALEMIPELERVRHSEIAIHYGDIAVKVRRSPAQANAGYILVARCGSDARVGVVPGWREVNENLLRELAGVGITEVITISRKGYPPIGLGIYQPIV